MSWNKRITDLANQPENNGQLPSIIFPCAVEYIDNDGSSICWECANGGQEHSPWKIVDYALLYAEEELKNPLLCESCGKTIDPALRKDNLAMMMYVAKLIESIADLGLIAQYHQARVEYETAEYNAKAFWADHKPSEKAFEIVAMLKTEQRDMLALWDAAANRIWEYLREELRGEDSDFPENVKTLVWEAIESAN